MIKNKYKCGDQMVLVIDISKPGSNFWKGLCSAWSLVQENTIWRIGNGGSINFSKDCRIPNADPFINFLIGSVSTYNLSSSISDCISSSNAWNVGKFSHLILDAITNRIKAGSF